MGGRQYQFRDPVVTGNFVTTLMLLLALFLPAHQLGYADAYLWGQSSTWIGRYFADSWEMVQHVLFALTVGATALTWWRRSWIAAVALLFTALVLASLRRSMVAEHEYWSEYYAGFFTACAGWAISLWGITLATWLRARGVARDAAPAPAARQLDR